MKSILLFLILFSSCIFASKPNVILIMADDMGTETVEDYGAKDYKTPNLSKMADDGILFTNMHSQALCTPSRVKIMTGRYNKHNYEQFAYLNPEAKTIGHLMKETGYKNIVAGKWQLHDKKTGNNTKRGMHPKDAGFDKYCLWQVERENIGSRYYEPSIETWETNSTPNLVKHSSSSFGPDIMSNCITDFITAHKDTSFFVYYPTVLPHDPFITAPGYTNKSNSKAKFVTMVEYLDKIVGNIRSKLEELKLDSNTLIMFTTDNGTHKSITSTLKSGESIVGEKGKSKLYGHRVPFLATWPGKIPARTTSDKLMDLSVFYPTLAEIVKAPLEENIDGVSILSDLYGDRNYEKNWVYIHYDPKWGSHVPATYVLNDKYKIYSDGRFYNYLSDRSENQNLTADKRTPEQQSIYNELNQILTSNGKYNGARTPATPPQPPASAYRYNTRNSTPSITPMPNNQVLIQGKPGVKISIHNIKGNKIEETMIPSSGNLILKKQHYSSKVVIRIL